ncbi:MAG: tRNA dihydrouridine synthase DusB [Pseudomonadota bacterium]
MRIGSHSLASNVVVAPMAGVTDRPFRQLCRRFGAGLAVSEMISADPGLRLTGKSRRRANHAGEVAPVSVQIAGADPAQLAQSARYNADRGAEIIDINMGCPAKKVCNAYAGSALLRDEPLVARILEAVVAAVDVPVTLKIRTGWDPANRNARRVARIAESAGIQALAIHGRTRACGFGGRAEYDTIAEVKAEIRIPVIANGDIADAEAAARVMARTGADAVMIGRAAQGRPWIFRDIRGYLEAGVLPAPPTLAEIRAVMLGHLAALYAFYGEFMGVRIARKHIGWYTRDLGPDQVLKSRINAAESPQEQLRLAAELFDRLEAGETRSSYAEELAA